MSRPSVRILITGLVLAVLGGVLVDAGTHLGGELAHLAELGLGAGAVLGLVHTRPAGWRAGAFALGLGLSWFGYALRAGVMPDIPMGRAVALAAVIVLITVPCALSGGRLPLWAGLLGAGTFAGAYEAGFTSSPTSFTTQSVTALTSIAIATAVAFLVAELGSALIGETDRSTGAAEEPTAEAGGAAGLALPRQKNSSPTNVDVRQNAPAPSSISKGATAS